MNHEIASKKINARSELFRRRCYKFSRNPLSMFGLVIVAVCMLFVLFAQYLVPFPDDAQLTTHMTKTFQAPSLEHIAGTDEFGRDVFSRAMIGLRYSLLTSIIVLGLSVPFGVFLGLIAGYYRNTWIDSVITRFTEMFMAIPTLVTAMVISALAGGGWFVGAVAIAVSWWAWFCRLTYTSAISVSNELFVVYAELSGVKVIRVILQDILPNISAPIITKISLDMGSVIIIAASLNFIGLGVQPPTPSLGAMVATGISYLPQQWWMCTFPAIIIMLVVLGFNLLGDGLGDALTLEVK
ncbi:MAG: ABC transporter permease [Oscillospiraceae bacterium]|nr:ABC transporter permease [Oscillospiraceae bacterium]